MILDGLIASVSKRPINSLILVNQIKLTRGVIIFTAITGNVIFKAIVKYQPADGFAANVAQCCFRGCGNPSSPAAANWGKHRAAAGKYLPG